MWPPRHDSFMRMLGRGLCSGIPFNCFSPDSLEVGRCHSRRAELRISHYVGHGWNRHGAQRAPVGLDAGASVAEHAIPIALHLSDLVAGGVQFTVELNRVIRRLNGARR